MDMYIQLLHFRMYITYIKKLSASQVCKTKHVPHYFCTKTYYTWPLVALKFFFKLTFKLNYFLTYFEVLLS